MEYANYSWRQEVTGNIYYMLTEKQERVAAGFTRLNITRLEPSNNYLYLYYSGSGYDWILMNKEISDRRYKRNIADEYSLRCDVINNENQLS